MKRRRRICVFCAFVDYVFILSNSSFKLERICIHSIKTWLGLLNFCGDAWHVYGWPYMNGLSCYMPPTFQVSLIWLSRRIIMSNLNDCWNDNQFILLLNIMQFNSLDLQSSWKFHSYYLASIKCFKKFVVAGNEDIEKSRQQTNNIVIILQCTLIQRK